jgi:hypothetical protein
MFFSISLKKYSAILFDTLTSFAIIAHRPSCAADGVRRHCGFEAKAQRAQSS